MRKNKRQDTLRETRKYEIVSPDTLFNTIHLFPQTLFLMATLFQTLLLYLSALFGPVKRTWQDQGLYLYLDCPTPFGLHSLRPAPFGLKLLCHVP